MPSTGASTSYLSLLFAIYHLPFARHVLLNPSKSEFSVNIVGYSLQIPCKIKLASLALPDRYFFSFLKEK